ncbi:hypothetical protein MASR2M78_28030 [Treponema sp.]
MIREKCLVLYKNHPALVDGIDDKISIRIRGGEKSRVREKDIEFLHPGPVSDLSGFSDQIPEGDLEGAWALLEGSTSNLQELSELVFGGWSPQNAWQAWLLLKDGLYFSGTINSIQACNKDDIEKEKEKRGGKAKEAQDREAFLERLRKNSLDLSDDARRLQDVEALALGKSEKSRTLKDLGKEESPIQAHKVLLSSGFWTTSNNPYPSRFGLSLSSAKEPIAAPPDEDRLDLTGLRSFAIDNAWSGDPDDAISWMKHPVCACI